MQIAAADGTPFRGDLITRVVLRTDLTPIPATVEIEAVYTSETAAGLAEGLLIKVGSDQTEYLIVKVGAEKNSGLVRGSRALSTVSVVGILASCAAIGRRTQRSIIRENSNFADLYRSMGATAVIGSDFPVPVFGCFVGMLPTPEIARVLHEESAVVFYAKGKLQFRRLAELISEKAAITIEADATEEVKSDYLERHAVPFAFTTTPTGALLSSRREAARGIVYRPRADLRILNNLGTALIQRRKLREGLQPGFNAGMRVDIAGVPLVVITAAHVRSTSEDGGGGEEYTQLWLGEYVK